MTALWTEICLAFPTLDALRDGFEIYPVVDAVGGTSPEAHRAGLERIVQAGARPISWVGLAGELQRDWARADTVGDLVDIVLTTRLLTTARRTTELINSLGELRMSKAVVLTKYGPPDVLVWKDVAMPDPGPRQVRIRVKCAGVSPTDLKIRRGDVQAVFRLPADAVLGFEAAGVVDAVGSSVEGVKNRDEVACLLPDLGGYAEYALASSWIRKPADVSWSDAAALPSSAGAAGGG